MTLLRWGPEYESGIPAIDDDHKRFFEYINDLEISMMVGRSKEELRSVLEGLVRYTQGHFAVEEQHMVDVTYPNYILHKAEHERFQRIIRGFRERLESNPPGLSIELLNFLRDWVKDHLKNMDLQFAAYYHEHMKRKNKEI